MADTTGSNERPETRPGWLTRLRSGLARSTTRLTGGITEIFRRRKIDDETLEELEDLLITADLGPAAAARLTTELGRTRFGKEVDEDEIREALAGQITDILTPVAVPLEIERRETPTVVLVVGVNGSGKTTTIGKLANQWKREGRSVIVVAGDTFRAAAIEQLQIWGTRADVPVLTRDSGADPAGLVFDAMEVARRQATDILLIDTAGRLQNKNHLMDELRKIVRVIGKKDGSAPHHTLLVLDATTGQNAHAQVEVFRDMVNVSGLILTKLDGSARGGVLVALAEKFKLPVHAIGIGEGIEDLRPFAPRDFARSLMGLEE